LLHKGIPVSLVIYLTTNPRRPPPYALAITLVGFASSLVWLNIEAIETVSILETFGIAFGIDSCA
jgi:predicted RND superfamily exporter protein